MGMMASAIAVVVLVGSAILLAARELARWRIDARMCDALNDPPGTPVADTSIVSGVDEDEWFEAGMSD
jgi:hypothetical protein